MERIHEIMEAGEDENGIYLMISLGELEPMKVYMNEFFEDLIEEKTQFTLKIEPQEPEKKLDDYQAAIPDEDLIRIRESLGLKPEYFHLNPELNAHNYLKGLYQAHPAKYRFNLENREEHKKWSRQARSALAKITGYDTFKKSDLNIEESEPVEFRNLILKRIVFNSTETLKCVGILARPKELKEPAPGIIALHGHNNGKICTTAMWPSISRSYYGIQLAERGYVTLSLDQWGWGERAGKNGNSLKESEKHYTKVALLLGKTVLGIRSWDVTRAIDFLQQYDFVGDKFAVIGQSGGGSTAAFSSVLDERIEAAVVSGFFCTTYRSSFSIYHCVCNYVPDFLKYFDLPDMLAIRAPKPLFIVAGEKDPIFPVEGVHEGYKTLEKAYELFGKRENLGLDIIESAGHEFRGDYCYPWLDRILLEK